MHGPDPMTRHPIPGHPRVAYLKPLVTAANIEVGEYTYYDDPDGPERFAEKCVLYHYDFIGDRLIIGRYSAIAADVRFIMNGANHPLSGISTYPFQIFGSGWEAGFDPEVYKSALKGDTRVGNDVWIGYRATMMPGVTIGNGAIVAAMSVVTGDVPPYAIVAGNPARVVRLRFQPDEVARLLRIAWWDWDADKVTRHLDLLRAADIDALEQAT